MSSIFSTYSGGENRVTASILAVLQSLSLGRIEWLLGALLQQSEFQLIRFENQPSKGAVGVPDAVIQSSFHLLLETKIATNSVDLSQIRRHLQRLEEAKETTKALLVLTPDDSQPSVLEAVSDQRLVWASFAALDQAIDELLTEKEEVVSEREAFLLRELQKMLSEEGLLASVETVVIVAAKNAWPEYQELHAYVCQPNRTFQKAGRLGFYSKGEIHPLVPRILESHPDVEFQRGKHPGQLGKLVDRLLDEGLRQEGGHYKVMFLSPPDSSETTKLSKPIANNKKSSTGKTTAFTMGHRYVSIDALRRAKTTADLDGD